jgi:hypothetical protein
VAKHRFTIVLAFSERLAARAHRRALLAWPDELDAVHGGAADQIIESADRLLDEVFGPDGSSRWRPVRR